MSYNIFSLTDTYTSAFKCSCFAVMKVKRDERSDEQKALAKECMAKRKEHKDSKKEEKETPEARELYQV